MSNIDVDLNELLGVQTSDNTTDGASADNSAEDNSSVTASETANNEETSKRAQDRIRELVEENNKLKEKNNSTEPVDLDSFLSQINDEGTRTLLKEYGKVMEKTIEKKYQPVLSNYNEDRFEKQFAQFAEKLPNLSQHKEELKKEFTRNPNADVKSMIGNLAVEILSSKITPLETKASQAPRDSGQIESLPDDKEALYALLKAKKN